MRNKGINENGDAGIIGISKRPKKRQTNGYRMIGRKEQTKKQEVKTIKATREGLDMKIKRTEKKRRMDKINKQQRGEKDETE
jgi:hypothetical protein